MRIGIDARMFSAKNATGIGVYVEKLINEILKQDAKNSYFIFLKSEEINNLKVNKDKVIKVAADIHWYTLAEQTQLPKLLKKYNLDLVHFPHFNVPLFYNRDFVVTIHDITPKLFPGPLVKKSIYRRLAYNLVFKHAVGKSKKIIAISQHTKQNIIKSFHIGQDKIEVIYPGLTVLGQPSESQKLAIKEKYNILKPYIFYVGVWRDHKNIPNLVKAFDIVKKDFDCQLVLASQPNDAYPEISQSINLSPNTNDIIVTGFLQNQDLAALYAAADIFVLPSFEEGFGLVAIESIFYGTPVIASNTTSVPEVLGDGGLYFDPNKPDELAKLISKLFLDPEIANRLVQNGKQRISQFDWRKTAEKTLAVYNQISPLH